MKHFISCFTVVALLFHLTSCGKSGNENSTNNANDGQNEVESQVIVDTTDTAIESHPSGRICFVSDDIWGDDIDPILIIVNSDGSEVRELSVFSDAQLSYIEEIKWGNTQSTLAVIANRGGATNVFLVDTSTEQCQAITNDDTYKRDLSWSPDGSFIAYTQVDHSFRGVEDIVLLNVETGETEQLTNTGVSDVPRWSQDSQTIYYQNESWEDIEAVDIEGCKITLLQSQIDSVLIGERGYGLDYRECMDSWESSPEVCINTPHWEFTRTYFDSPPTFGGIITATPDGHYVIVQVSIGFEFNKDYFAMVDPVTYECTILDTEEIESSYGAPTEKVFWVNTSEFLFLGDYTLSNSYGERSSLSGIILFNTDTGQKTWIVCTEETNSLYQTPYEEKYPQYDFVCEDDNAQYNITCWDYIVEIPYVLSE
ncbi:MAG: PD40 domain-containing protein [Candidatus Sabulitectum sp.]|nr:PD40 domain-containing protein [Candidatus Sabulitectum sp.]